MVPPGADPQAAALERATVPWPAGLRPPSAAPTVPTSKPLRTGPDGPHGRTVRPSLRKVSAMTMEEEEGCPRRCGQEPARRTTASGRPRVLDATAAPGWKPAHVLRLAASLDQYSPYVLAQAIVDAARERGLALSMPTEVSEEPGRGATGIVEGRGMTIGRLETCHEGPAWVRSVDNRALLDGAAVAWLTVDDRRRRSPAARPVAPRRAAHPAPAACGGHRPARDAHWRPSRARPRDRGRPRPRRPFYAGRYLHRHGLDRAGLRVRTRFTMATDRPARVASVHITTAPPTGLPEQCRAALLAVASHCTVHDTLHQPPEIGPTPGAASESMRPVATPAIGDRDLAAFTVSRVRGTMKVRPAG